MSENSNIQLKSSSVFTIPLQTYENDFSFIVNGKEFKTSRLISELLSPKICKCHNSDPTQNLYYINTKNSGDFTKILDLASFRSIVITESEIPFLIEIIEQLETTSIEVTGIEMNIEFTNDNIFKLLDKYEQSRNFYSTQYESSIEYIASHFFELCQSHEEEMMNLQIETLYRIVKNRHLHLMNEDQLLKFANKMYSKDAKYFVLYDCVLFCNVESETICEFVDIFNINDINKEIWMNISTRLKEEIKKIELKNSNDERYEEKKVNEIVFTAKDDDKFDGIINHIRMEAKGNINDKIKITSSTVVNGSYIPSNVIEYEDREKWFHSENQKNGWICFEFKENKIIPTNYKLRSSPYCINEHNPKSWIIEGSNDNSNWEKLDEEQNSPHLNGKHLVHLFSISNPKSTEYRYIRMRLTGPNHCNYDYFMLDSFEIYGDLI